MASATRLTNNDAAILSALFDPEASLAPKPEICSSLSTGDNTGTLESAQAEERDILTLIERNDSAETGSAAAVAAFDELIRHYPRYGSAYNTRAQARRMCYPFEELLQHPQELNNIIIDLATAISLSSPLPGIQGASPAQARVLAAAYTHRAFLLWKASRSTLPPGLLQTVDGLSGASSETLEDMASRDFQAGARYGNQIAKQLAVKTNPYAKLCGQIVKEALQREMSTYFDEDRH
jgi:hypothetical protein